MREGELRQLGVAEVGENVAVHETCVLVGLQNMRFGSNVRVDPFTLLSAADGWLATGDFVHISSHVTLLAGSGVEVGDFVNLSAGVRVFSRSDDYGGDFLISPTVPKAYCQPAATEAVRIGRHVLVGANTVILPEVRLGEGASVGAGALVNRHLDPWHVYAGQPARAIKPRKRNLLELEAALRAALASGACHLPVSAL
jgi:galactoside O-acetyltransferase